MLHVSLTLAVESSSTHDESDLRPTTFNIPTFPLEPSRVGTPVDERHAG